MADISLTERRVLAAGEEVGWFHPGCMAAEEAPSAWLAPGPPGLPCLPSPPPTDPAPATDTTTSSDPRQGPVRFTINNRSELPFSITLTGQQTYVLNVASGESKVFVVTRGVYSFDMMLCAVRAQGAVDLSKFTTMNFNPCVNDKLVKVMIANEANTQLAVTLEGTRSYIFSIPAGASQLYTIARGDYAFFITGCKHFHSGDFQAKSNQTLTLNCP